ncbi:hypothetical protein [Pontibacter sp. G13]|uniref:hypothetical protein n=1 Tax=Pontibacter sp. G13 TaxID=3074898 RepID=UPI00288A5696|nr:hypothetical protein [Pontibacter sp. G13]WNJ19329.1 hypothetical protein RJD25_02455 [Pontibacter sp. G13]
MSFSNRLLVGLFCVLCIVLTAGCKQEEPIVEESDFCFDYTIAEVPYQSLQNPTLLEYEDLNEDWVFDMPIGFDFPFCDSVFSDFHVVWDYSPTFRYEMENGLAKRVGFELFPYGRLSIGQSLDGPLDGGWVGYETTGEAGNRVFTVEYNRVGLLKIIGEEQIPVTFQVQLRESNHSVSYHYGAHEVDFPLSELPYSRMFIGLLGADRNDGLHLHGNPANPQTYVKTDSISMTYWPAQDTRYQFIQ